jgi:hypothetical protein
MTKRAINMPTGQPFRTKEEVEAREGSITAQHLAALINDGRLWPIGEQRLDEVTGRLEYWDGARWTSYVIEPFTKGAAVLTPTAQNIVIWEAPYDATVQNVRAFQNGGSTGSTFNARRNGTDSHLSSDGTISSLDTWVDGGTVQNTAYVSGDRLEVQIISVSGSPTHIVIQIQMEQTV